MDDKDVRLNDQVRYIGVDKFGYENEHTGQIFTVTSRKFDYGSDQYLFHIVNEWDEERFNVPASSLEVI